MTTAPLSFLPLRRITAPCRDCGGKVAILGVFDDRTGIRCRNCRVEYFVAPVTGNTHEE